MDDYLHFREQLRGDEHTSAAYEKLKRELATRFPNDRAAYTSGKNDFIEGVLTAHPRVERSRDAGLTASWDTSPQP